MYLYCDIKHNGKGCIGVQPCSPVLVFRKEVNVKKFYLKLRRFLVDNEVFITIILAILAIIL